MSTDPTGRQSEKPASNGDSVPKGGLKSHLDTRVHFPRLPLIRKGYKLTHPSRFINFNSVSLAVCMVLGTIIGNFRRHGFLINPLVWVNALKVDGQISLLPLALLIPWPLFPIVSLLIEKGLASGKLSDLFGKVAHIFWIIVIFIYPIAVMAVYGRPMIIAAGFPLFLAYCGLILKMWSFADTNQWYREKWLAGKKASEDRKEGDQLSENKEQEQSLGVVSGPKIQYPDNLTLKGLLYFLFLPTFCYELDYPTTGKRNYKAIAWRFAAFLLNTVALFVVVQQWTSPTVQYLLPPYAKGHTWVFLERLLATIVTEHMLWILQFFFLFHTYSTLLAEILCFSDRKYYEDWWQAETIDDFWRKWNLPVHNWAVRHLYLPLIQKGYSKKFARYAVFTFSGVLHEYFASGPLRIFRLHFFFGFIVQYIILGDLTRYVSKKFGREMGISLTSVLIMWIALLPLIYTHDVIIAYSGVKALEGYPYF